MKRYFAELDETWEVFQVIAEEFRDLGESVLVVMRLEARGGASGLPITGRQGLICEFRDDKLSRVRSFLDHADALRAVGLSE